MNEKEYKDRPKTTSPIIGESLLGKAQDTCCGATKSPGIEEHLIDMLIKNYQEAEIIRTALRIIEQRIEVTALDTLRLSSCLNILRISVPSN